MTVFGSLKIRGTYCGFVPGVPFWIIIGGQWLIWAAVEYTWPQRQVFLGSSIRPVLHAIHISVCITRTGHVGSVFHQSTRFPFLTHSYHPPCLRSQTLHHYSLCLPCTGMLLVTERFLAGSPISPPSLCS